jgi:hypothetical protein
MSQTTRPFLSAMLWIFALACLANAAAMLFFAHAWFFRLVPGVPETGPFNFHLVADSGTFYLAVGIGLIAGALNPQRNAIAVVIAAVASTAHASLHIWSHASGWLSPAHLTSEVFLIYIPTAVLCGLAVSSWRSGMQPRVEHRRAA